MKTGQFIKDKTGDSYYLFPHQFSKQDILVWMQEYADLQTSALTKQLEEKDVKVFDLTCQRNSINTQLSESKKQIEGIQTDNDFQSDKIVSLQNELEESKALVEVQKTTLELDVIKINTLTEERDKRNEDIVDEFVNSLFNQLNILGVNTDDCDGDTNPEDIIAKWFVGKTSDLKAELDNSEKAHDITLEQLMESRSQLTSLELAHKQEREKSDKLISDIYKAVDDKKFGVATNEFWIWKLINDYQKLLSPQAKEERNKVCKDCKTHSFCLNQKKCMYPKEEGKEG